MQKSVPLLLGKNSWKIQQKYKFHMKYVWSIFVINILLTEIYSFKWRYLSGYIVTGWKKKYLHTNQPDKFKNGFNKHHICILINNLKFYRENIQATFSSLTELGRNQTNQAQNFSFHGFQFRPLKFERFLV